MAKKIDVPFNGTKEQEERLKSELAALKESGGEGLLIAALQKAQEMCIRDSFARGGKIENTPYEPQREGYNFAGWYKESECEHVWDFAEDTLPAAEYDEQGNLIFTETKLFANWTKS